MKKLLFLLAIGTLILSVVGCQKKVTAASKGILFDTIYVDTLAVLADSGSTAHCDIQLNLIFMHGDDYEKVNDSLLRYGLLSPEYLSLNNKKLSAVEAVDSFVERYIADYRDFYTLVYAEEQNDTTATISYHVITELADGRSGITNYIAHVVTNQGAGPTAYTQVFNIDLNNNRLLRPQDVFLDGYEQPLSEIIVNRMARQLAVDGLPGLRQKGYFVQCDPYPTTNFQMADRKMRFIYVKGEIADREKDEVVVEVPYSQLKHLLR